MNAHESSSETSAPTALTELTTELLILPDGQVLVHNLTVPFAELLAGLEADGGPILSRNAAAKSLSKSHELPG